MLYPALRIPPSTSFWFDSIKKIIKHCEDLQIILPKKYDFSSFRVVVPNSLHIQCFKKSFNKILSSKNYIPPFIGTFDNWLELQAFNFDFFFPIQNHEKLLYLYLKLQKNYLLKKNNVNNKIDLLIFSRVLIKLFHELTQALLPSIYTLDKIKIRWKSALNYLSPFVRTILKDEIELIWSIWCDQIKNDEAVWRFINIQKLIIEVEMPLIWFTSIQPSPIEINFLNNYSKNCSVLPIIIDWSKIPYLYFKAWPEIQLSKTEFTITKKIISPLYNDDKNINTPSNISICSCNSLEDIAIQGAQNIINWLILGYKKIAIIELDSLVVRRICSLLERSKVFVFNKVGCKLSNTSAAAFLISFFNVIDEPQKSNKFLIFLKSPYILNDISDKSNYILIIESICRDIMVFNNLDFVLTKLKNINSNLHELIQKIINKYKKLNSKYYSVSKWNSIILKFFLELNIDKVLDTNESGKLLLKILSNMYKNIDSLFTFFEYRKFIELQMDMTRFISKSDDHRVIVLSISDVYLLRFNAILIVGIDINNFPSLVKEILFFSNTFRKKLKLKTNYSLRQKQLRELTELLCCCEKIMLLWQIYKNSELNFISPLIERLQLILNFSEKKLRTYRSEISLYNIKSIPINPPLPSCSELLPNKISITSYNNFIACPYKFFAQNMLNLNSINNFYNIPQKYHYGNWVHKILFLYHSSLNSSKKIISLDERFKLLNLISEKIFKEAIKICPVSLNYYIFWKKSIQCYLKWSYAHESFGWNFIFGEKKYKKTLFLFNNKKITLYGRIDRIDKNNINDKYLILDYKTSDYNSLRKKIYNNEDYQLLLYKFLLEKNVNISKYHAQYIVLSSKQIKIIDIPENILNSITTKILISKIKKQMHSIATGAPLPALGVESICRFCNMKGLCRKKEWLIN
ncbi:PD-(D/E)XK nuclease family protein [Candidatus Profftella armatura (Diaphorina cf. continua)]|uniref:PD-(D/E)XK nuclease family protein n=1 Tax=Candidatus Profftella armatura (Diaphorina cf. continua) TaxID=2661583 RepID=A0A7R6W0A4_9PROT|nr:PD-(D/E)XK nuclease family protein [Candidatus Profftella armatura (Diaphorina cf. continua)]BCG49768.1 PD-(D/E)XK nuclease family protein [Candidatus Profftella armatura (Diaphorina cf. continua)]